MRSTKFFAREGVRSVIITLPATALIFLAAVGLAVAAPADHRITPGGHSSITTTVGDPSGNVVAANRALTTAAKIDVAQAAGAAARAVPGGTVTSVELANEKGNVVYTVTIGTPTKQAEVTIDAGNAEVLGTLRGQDNVVARNKVSSSGKPKPSTAGQSSQGAKSGSTRP